MLFGFSVATSFMVEIEEVVSYCNVSEKKPIEAYCGVCSFSLTFSNFIFYALPLIYLFWFFFLCLSHGRVLLLLVVLSLVLILVVDLIK